jgi:hypothetical protein
MEWAQVSLQMTLSRFVNLLSSLIASAYSQSHDVFLPTIASGKMKFTSSLVLALLCSGASAFYVQSPVKVSNTALNTWTGPTTSEKTQTQSPTSTSTSYTFPGTQSSRSNMGTMGSNNMGTMSNPSTSINTPTSRSSMFEEKEKSQMKKMWDSLSPIIVQGGSLRTWSFATPDIERVQVMLRSDGRPLHANVELWQGPDNTPVKMNVYNEDGYMRPFSAVIETPRGQNSIAIRNTGQMEFPLSAALGVDVGGAVGKGKADLGSMVRKLNSSAQPRTVQGGAVQTFPFDASVSSVQVMLKTDGRPLNARLELLQGPNNNKQVIDLYCEDGMERPFYAVIETPGSGNVIRVVNTATMEFPMSIRVEPFETNGSFASRGQESYFNIL